MENQETGVEINKLCRLCLTQENTMSSIFNEDESSIIPLPLRIMACVSVEIQPTDCLPSHICGTCLCQVDGWLKFKDLCETADSVMKQFLQNEPITVERISQVQEMAKQWKQQYSCNKSDDENKRTPKCKTDETQTPTHLYIDSGEILKNSEDVFADVDDDVAAENKKKKDKIKVGVTDDCDTSFDKFKEESTVPSERDVKTERCDLCFNYYEPSFLLTHKITVHKVVTQVTKRKNFKCKECSLTFDVKSELYKHRIEQHDDLQENCKLCDEKIPLKDVEDHRFHVHGIRTRNNFLCMQCNCKFTTRGDLQRHKFKAHCLPGTDRTLLPCNICAKTFLKTSLARHKFEAHGIRDITLRKGKPTKCGHCNEIFQRRYEFVRHSCNNPPKKKEYKHCDVCNLQVLSTKMKKHKAQHGIKNKRTNYKCQDCNEVFINKKLYISHRKVFHLGILKEHHCKKCYDSFDTKQLLDEHLEQVCKHNGIYTCTVCGKTFQSEGGLRMHQNKHQKKFQCDVCHMNLSSNASLLTHKTKHTGAKPYTCNICDKSFPYASSLNYHMRTHEDKKFVCQFCGQRFTFSFNFTRHMIQHHGVPDEKMVCELCGGLFAKHRIKDHLASHGKPTVPCDICGKKFKLKDQVRKHKNSVHKDGYIIECPICLKCFTKKELLDEHFCKHTLATITRDLEVDSVLLQSSNSLDNVNSFVTFQDSLDGTIIHIT